MFRFTIRDLLWLTVVVGLVVTWWVENQGLRKSTIALATAQEEAGLAESYRRDIDEIGRQLPAFGLEMIVVTEGTTTYPQLSYAAIGSKPEYSQDPADQSRWGEVKLKFIYDGPTPAARALPPRTKDCAKFTLVDETWQIDHKSKGVANVFVYLATTRSVPEIHPDLQKAESEQVTIAARECRFEPHGTILRIVQTLVLKNDDPFGHNFHCLLARNATFSDLLPTGASIQKKPTALKRVEEQPATLVCGIHPHMTGRLLIVNHPYAALSDRLGSVTLAKLPLGKHAFFVWHEGAKSLDGDSLEGKGWRIVMEVNREPTKAREFKIK